MNRLSLAGAALLAGALAASCASHPPADGAAATPLVVGCDFTNAPFAWRDGARPPEGRDVEMTRALCARLGRPLVWEQRPFDQLLGGVERGQLDAAVATLGITPERAERVAFTDPYFETDVLALVRAGDGEPRTLADLHGRPVAAGVGTTSERAVRLRVPGAVLAVPSDKDGSSVALLLAGAIDAAIMDGPDARDAARDDPRLTWIAEPLAAERYAIAVRPDAPELVAALNAALAELREEGVLAELDERYGTTAAR